MIVHGLILYGLLIAWIPIRALRWVRELPRAAAALETDATNQTLPPGSTRKDAADGIQAAPQRARRRLGQLLLWCAAVPDPQVSNSAVFERRQAMAVGLSVVLTGGTAAVAMVLFLRLIMPGSWLRALAFGLFWGLLVLGVDRRVVSTTTFAKVNDGSASRSDGRRSHWGRLAVALVLAATVSGPVFIGFFEPEIDRQVTVALEAQRVAAAEQVGQRADFVDRRDKIEVAVDAAEATEQDKNQALSAAQTALDEEISGRGGTGVPGCAQQCVQKRSVRDAAKADADAATAAAAAARGKAQADTAALNTDITAAIKESDVVANDAPLARPQALMDALATYPVFWIRWIAVTAVLLLGDLLPLLRTGRARTQALATKPTMPTASTDDPARPGSERPTDLHVGPDPHDLRRATALSATASAGQPRTVKPDTVSSPVAGAHPATDPDLGQHSAPAEPLTAPAVSAVTTTVFPAQEQAAGPTGRPQSTGTDIVPRPAAGRAPQPIGVAAATDRLPGPHHASVPSTEHLATPAMPGGMTTALTHEPEIAPTLAWLNAVEGVGGNYLLGLTVNKVGRSSTADIVVPRATVSRHHCTISNDGSRLLLAAEPSSNGTYVNHARIAAGQPIELRNGDILGLGTKIQLEVFIPEAGQQTARLMFRCAGETEVGGRTSNEDAFHVDDQVIAVADGVGGRPAGEVAAVLAVQGLRGVRGTADLYRAVHAVNAKVRGRGVADPLTSGLASTLDAAVLSAEGGTPWVHGVHVGDGMALLQRPRRVEVVWLTRAHTLAAEIQAASPNAATAGGAEHPQGGRLMRAVGFAEEIQADEWQEQAEEGQRYLLASDGLVHALGEDGLRHAVAELRAADPSTCARSLVAKSLDAGADDNVTVVVADVVTRAAPTKQTIRHRKDPSRG